MRATGGSRKTAMPLSSVTADASRGRPRTVVPRKARVVRRSGVRPRLKRTRTLPPIPTVVTTSAGWATALTGCDASSLADTEAPAELVRRMSQAAALAITSPPAPAVRRSAQSRSVGRNLRQLRRTSSATSVCAKSGFVSNRISSVLSSGGGDCAASGATNDARTRSPRPDRTLRPGTGRTFEPYFHRPHISIQALIASVARWIRSRHEVLACHVVRQPPIFHLLETTRQSRTPHPACIEHARPHIERGQRERQRVGPAVQHSRVVH